MSWKPLGTFWFSPSVSNSLSSDFAISVTFVTVTEILFFLHVSSLHGSCDVEQIPQIPTPHPPFTPQIILWLHEIFSGLTSAPLYLNYLIKPLQACLFHSLTRTFVSSNSILSPDIGASHPWVWERNHCPGWFPQPPPPPPPRRPQIPPFSGPPIAHWQSWTRPAPCHLPSQRFPAVPLLHGTRSSVCSLGSSPKGSALGPQGRWGAVAGAAGRGAGQRLHSGGGSFVLAPGLHL